MTRTPPSWLVSRVSSRPSSRSPYRRSAVLISDARHQSRRPPPIESHAPKSRRHGRTELTISLVAVMIPLLFMSDIVGRLFREFAVTLSTTILVSGLVSLTLVPMACGKLLRPLREADENVWQRASRRMFDAVLRPYGRALDFVLDHQSATLAVFLGTLVATGALYVVIPKGFFPQQDTGVIQAVTEGAQSVSFKRLG
ncbi:MAG: efflux RND transporter permease subunit, partial [Hyphomicrobium sp.]|nr:efflux RND transporter permease subunit [Hyphomicrobium sp.]